MGVLEGLVLCELRRCIELSKEISGEYHQSLGLDAERLDLECEWHCCVVSSIG